MCLRHCRGKEVEDGEYGEYGHGVRSVSGLDLGLRPGAFVPPSCRGRWQSLLLRLCLRPCCLAWSGRFVCCSCYSPARLAVAIHIGSNAPLTPSLGGYCLNEGVLRLKLAKPSCSWLEACRPTSSKSWSFDASYGLYFQEPWPLETYLPTSR